MSAPTPVSKTKPCPDCPIGQAKQIALKSSRCGPCYQIYRATEGQVKSRHTQIKNRCAAQKSAGVSIPGLAGRQEMARAFAPVTNHLSGAATSDMSVAIRDGFAVFGPSGFDLHKNNAARTYQAKAKRTAPATGSTVLTRHWKSNDGRFQESPLTIDGRFTR